MTPPPTPADETQAALDEYLAALEAGAAPPRAEFLARHPGVAVALAAALDALEAVRAGGPAADELLLHSLGEYQILGVAGRGGMGVVYEALQLDPPRRVALKVMSAAARYDRVACQRFLTEIAIASHLHHTNIVPVLATVLGDGSPVGYSMPYIRGRSLAAALHEAREGHPAGSHNPTFAWLGGGDAGGHARAVAEWVRQAAEAVAAAHAAGVTHRDVKPGNLLIDFDRGGRPHVWLYDFGLAVHEDELAGELKTGGTPGYMSPEQAAGGPDGGRPPTDVYALGVTLAELLTLRKPVEGRAVSAGHGVPRELRRVIAKATAARAADRYPTAAGLADDLTRFLAGFPVHAGRAVAYRTLAMWAGRHSRALTTAALGFVAAAAVGSAFLYRAYAAERAARRAAEEARAAVATHTLAIDDTLYATAGMLDTHRKLLEQAVEVHERQLDTEPSDGVAARRLAQAQWRLGRVYVRLGRVEDGIEQIRRSVVRYTVLAETEPAHFLHRLDLARSYSVLGGAYLAAGRPIDVRAAHADALRVARAAARDFPDNLDIRDALASHAAEHGESLLSAGRVAESAEVLREALEVANGCVRARPDRWQFVNAAATAWVRLARVSARRGRLADALRENAAALELNASLLARTSLPAPGASRLDVLSFRIDRVDLLVERATWTLAAGEDVEAALADLEGAARVIEHEHPDRVGAQANALAEVRAWAAFRAERPDGDACRAHEANLSGFGDLVSLSRYYAHGPGARDPARAVALARKAVGIDGDDPRAKAALGLALYRAGDRAGAEAELTRLADRPPHRSVLLVRVAIAAQDGRRDDARRLLAEASKWEVPLELCNPELEKEVHSLLNPAGR